MDDELRHVEELPRAHTLSPLLLHLADRHWLTELDLTVSVSDGSPAIR